jgi:hypothetical protein
MDFVSPLAREFRLTFKLIALASVHKSSVDSGPAFPSLSTTARSTDGGKESNSFMDFAGLSAVHQSPPSQASLDRDPPAAPARALTPRLGEDHDSPVEVVTKFPHHGCNDAGRFSRSIDYKILTSQEKLSKSLGMTIWSWIGLATPSSTPVYNFTPESWY